MWPKPKPTLNAMWHRFEPSLGLDLRIFLLTHSVFYLFINIPLEKMTNHNGWWRSYFKKKIIFTQKSP